MLNLAQDAVHDPVGGSGAESVTGTDALLAQMLHDVLDERLLHVLGIGDGELMVTRMVVELDGLVGEY